MREILTNLMSEHGNIKIYSGGANGIDQFAMEVGHFLQIPVAAILPFPSFSKLWPESGQQHFKELLDKCIEVRYVYRDEDITNKAAAVAAMMDRDKELVNVGDILIAYWNGSKGGTAHTVGFARQAKLDVLIFNPDLII